MVDYGLIERREHVGDLDEVRRLVIAGLRGYRATVLLFGSWATGSAGSTSDIDVAIMPLELIPQHVFSEIREALDDSRVIYHVDVVDLGSAPEEFRRRVLREGIPWND